MAELPNLVKDLALILIVAGVVTLLFKRLKQPLVLGYIVAGFLVSPHMPYTMSVIDEANIQTWADIGVIFLLFSLGLDFSFKKILKMGVAPAIACSIIIFAMIMLGVCAGKAFGWGRMDCIFLGGMLAMSSTTIIYKAFDDIGLRQQRFAGLVMSVLILEDIFAIVMMVMLAAIAGGNNPDGGEILQSIFRIAFFLILWFVVGIFLIPMFLRSSRKLMNNETLIIVSLGLCFLMSVISSGVGFSPAFGAFIMGSILAETIEADKIERLVEPVKNLFGAIFFVSVGMLVDPEVLIAYALPIIVIVLTIILGQSIFGSAGFLISGQSLKTSIKCGFSMAQIGEFAFIIASLGLSLGVISNFLYPVVVAVSVITTFLTPYMIRASEPFYGVIERNMPRRWIRQLDHLAIISPKSQAKEGNLWKALLRQLAVYVVIFSILSSAVITIMLAIFLPFIQHFVSESWAAAICGVLTIALIAPFLRAMVMKKNHSEEVKALWTQDRRNRLPILFTILVRVVIASAFVFYVCISLTHFARALAISIALAAVILMMMSRSLKHRSIKLERLFIQNLRSRDIKAQVLGKKKPLFEGHLIDRDLHIADFDLPEGSLWGGQPLSALRLRQRFNVHISSILRGRQRINIPGGDTVVFPGDCLQAIGDDLELRNFADAINKELFVGDPDIEMREMKLQQIVVDEQCPLMGKTLGESGLRDVYNIMLVGLDEGKGSLTTVTPARRFEYGDVLWVVGEEDNLRKLSS